MELISDIDPPNTCTIYEDAIECVKIGVSSGKTKGKLTHRSHIHLGDVRFRDVLIVEVEIFYCLVILGLYCFHLKTTWRFQRAFCLDQKGIIHTPGCIATFK